MFYPTSTGAAPLYSSPALHKRSQAPLACGPGSPELSNPTWIWLVNYLHLHLHRGSSKENHFSWNRHCMQQSAARARSTNPRAHAHLHELMHGLCPPACASCRTTAGAAMHDHTGFTCSAQCRTAPPRSTPSHCQAACRAALVVAALLVATGDTVRARFAFNFVTSRPTLPGPPPAAAVKAPAPPSTKSAPPPTPPPAPPPTPPPTPPPAPPPTPPHTTAHPGATDNIATASCSGSAFTASLTEYKDTYEVAGAPPPSRSAGLPTSPTPVAGLHKLMPCHHLRRSVRQRRHLWLQTAPWGRPHPGRRAAELSYRVPCHGRLQ